MAVQKKKEEMITNSIYYDSKLIGQAPGRWRREKDF
jgi:hypothetical protein